MAPLRREGVGTEGLGVLLRVLCRESPEAVTPTGDATLRLGVEDAAVAAVVARGAVRAGRGGVGDSSGEETSFLAPVRRLALACTPVSVSVSTGTVFFETWFATAIKKELLNSVSKQQCGR